MIDTTKKMLVLDTETTNDIDCPMVYDIGFAVVDILGNVYKTYSFVVADIFLDEELMASAFFADKIPQYWEEIMSGKRLLRKWKTIKNILNEVCKENEIKYIFAHNAIFDWKSCTLTQRYLTSSKYRYFFPYGVEVCDTLKMARKLLGNDEGYTTFCYENDYMTERNRIRYTAEIIYKFLTNDKEFEEKHTGLEDVLIEKEIMVYCFKLDPDFDPRLWIK